MTNPQEPRKPLTDEERARALLLPVSEPSGQQDLDGDGVPAVLPGRPEEKQPPTRPSAAGDEKGIVCWNCGVENRTDRMFCRNCGVELHNPPQAAAPPRRRRDVRRILLIVGGILAGLALLAGIAFGVGALIRALNDDDDDPAVPPAELLPAPPVAADASSQDPQHPAANAFDGRGDSWWGTGHQGSDGRGDVIQAEYTSPVDLRAIRIYPGASVEQANRDSQARPSRMQIVITDARGQQTGGSYELQDGEPLLVRVDAPDTRRVQFAVEGAYGVDPGKQVAVAEIQMFRTS